MLCSQCVLRQNKDTPGRYYQHNLCICQPCRKRPVPCMSRPNRKRHTESLCCRPFLPPFRAAEGFDFRAGTAHIQSGSPFSVHAARRPFSRFIRKPAPERHVSRTSIRKNMYGVGPPGRSPKESPASDPSSVSHPPPSLSQSRTIPSS